MGLLVKGSLKTILDDPLILTQYQVQRVMWNRLKDETFPSDVQNSRRNIYFFATPSRDSGGLAICQQYVDLTGDTSEKDDINIYFRGTMYIVNDGYLSLTDAGNKITFYGDQPYKLKPIKRYTKDEFEAKFGLSASIVKPTNKTKFDNVSEIIIPLTHSVASKPNPAMESGTWYAVLKISGYENFNYIIPIIHLE